MKPRKFKRTLLRGGVVALLLLIGACRKSPSPVPTPADPASPPANAAAAPAAPRPNAAEEDESAERPRPRVLLWVEGSPDEDTIWRGWPVLVRVQTLAGGPPTDLQMRGPSSVQVTRSGTVWHIAATESAKLAVGSYTLAAGDQELRVAVVEAPRKLTREQQSIHSRLLVQNAVAAGDTTAAKQAADAWAEAAPDAFEAREAQGDLLRMRGDPAGALEAYNAALQCVPRGIDPPPAGLHAKIAALLRERAAAVPSKPPTEPTTDEVKYYELIDAGDQALATGDRATASLRYAEAEEFHRARALAVSSLELDDKRAALVSTTPAAALGPARAATSAPPATTGAAPASLPAAPTSAATPAAPANSSPAPGTVIPAAELTDAKILADGDGQWASAATASSQYGSTTYSAAQATGAPNVGVAGNSPDAWCPANKNSGTDWLEVGFAKPVHATEVRLRQNDTVGAIARIEAIEPDGTAHVWWAGVDPFVATAARDIAWFAVRVPETGYLVAKIKISLDLAAVPGWKEIDAVQLVGKD